MIFFLPTSAANATAIFYIAAAPRRCGPQRTLNVVPCLVLARSTASGPRFLTRPGSEKKFCVCTYEFFSIHRRASRAAHSQRVCTSTKIGRGANAPRAPMHATGSHYVPAHSCRAVPISISHPAAGASSGSPLELPTRRDQSRPLNAKSFLFWRDDAHFSCASLTPRSSRKSASRNRGQSPLRAWPGLAHGPDERGKDNYAASGPARTLARRYPAAALRGPRAQERSDFRLIMCRNPDTGVSPNLRRPVSQILRHFRPKCTQDWDTPDPLDLKINKRLKPGTEKSISNARSAQNWIALRYRARRTPSASRKGPGQAIPSKELRSCVLRVGQMHHSTDGGAASLLPQPLQAS